MGVAQGTARRHSQTTQLTVPPEVRAKVAGATHPTGLRTLSIMHTEDGKFHVDGNNANSLTGWDATIWMWHHERTNSSQAGRASPRSMRSCSQAVSPSSDPKPTPAKLQRTDAGTITASPRPSKSRHQASAALGFDIYVNCYTRAMASTVASGPAHCACHRVNVGACGRTSVPPFIASTTPENHHTRAIARRVARGPVELSRPRTGTTDPRARRAPNCPAQRLCQSRTQKGEPVLRHHAKHAASQRQ